MVTSYYQNELGKKTLLEESNRHVLVQIIEVKFMCFTSNPIRPVHAAYISHMH